MRHATWCALFVVGYLAALTADVGWLAVSFAIAAAWVAMDAAIGRRDRGIPPLDDRQLERVERHYGGES